ncbi:hypothetical protein CAL23_13145 [Bordetella genomosp. 6]|uniref:Uncharacterized protein n=2 Tax=Bordetella genomosp. 6 TaxID=463024 RepID=A0ABX4FBP9_9BORD|nr:hypothetical protein CAL23_13145 [Bordetella genomosp. 6]
MLAAGFAIQHKNGLVRFAHALLDKYAPQASAEDVRNAALEAAAAHIESKKPVGTIALVVQAFADEVRTLKATPAPTAAEGEDDVALPPLPEFDTIFPSWGSAEMQGRFKSGALRGYARAAVRADRQRRNVNTTSSDVDIDRQRRDGDAPREDDMLTIAYLAGAQAEKERAGDALLAELLDDPLLRDLLGYIEDTGPADVWGAAQAWMAKRNAALAARKEGDGNAN